MCAAPCSALPRLVCAGCGTDVDSIGPGGPAWRCALAATGDIDHVLRRSDTSPAPAWPSSTHANPFVRYRTLLASHATALALGMSDDAFVAVVERLDARIAAIDGQGFSATPLRRESALAANVGLPCGTLLVKVEAEHVSGSHKARHLMGIMLMLEVARSAAGERAGWTPPRLAIASCGNAALAAAIVARAADYPLDVFVPEWAEGAVVDRLRRLGARVNACARTPGTPGDPCYHGFRDALAHGATPFCCQGPDNAVTIEGGETIAWEIVDACDGDVPDAVFVQVGGGALATAIARGFDEARRLGRATRVPRLHAVQTRGCAPLVRAYDRVVEHLLGAAGAPSGAIDTLSPLAAVTRIERARHVARDATGELIDAALAHAATHRSAYMRPWDVEPRSLATGILDDETYDWLACVDAMLRTGGYPVVADEDALVQANRVGCDVTGVRACLTGTAGLAGLIAALPNDPRLSGEQIAVVFSGHRR